MKTTTTKAGAPTKRTGDPYLFGRVMRANGTTLPKALELAPWAETHQDRTLLASGWLAEPVARITEKGTTKSPMAPPFVLVDRSALSRVLVDLARLESLAAVVPCACDPADLPKAERGHDNEGHRCPLPADVESLRQSLEA